MTSSASTGRSTEGLAHDLSYSPSVHALTLRLPPSTLRSRRWSRPVPKVVGRNWEVLSLHLSNARGSAHRPIGRGVTLVAPLPIFSYHHVQAVFLTIPVLQVDAGKVWMNHELLAPIHHLHRESLLQLLPLRLLPHRVSSDWASRSPRTSSLSRRAVILGAARSAQVSGPVRPGSAEASAARPGAPRCHLPIPALRRPALVRSPARARRGRRRGRTGCHARDM